MANRIFDGLVKEKIERFISAYMNLSKEIFFDGKALIHPGEYGRYREKICTDFLSLFIPNRLAMGDGFIMTSFDDVSTQCDIVLYDKLFTPTIQSNEMQTFYPIETVVGVIEVKSKMKLCELKEALIKLAKVKALRSKIKSPVIQYGKHGNGEPYNPVTKANDCLYTVLICEKFDFKTDNIEAEIDAIYPGDTEAYNKHNLILSIEDGIIVYNMSECQDLAKDYKVPLKQVNFPDPVCRGKALSCSYIKADKDCNHIKTFLNDFVHRISSIRILTPELMHYMTGFNAIPK